MHIGGSKQSQPSIASRVLLTFAFVLGTGLFASPVEARPAVEPKQDWVELSAESIQSLLPAFGEMQKLATEVRGWSFAGGGHGIFAWFARPDLKGRSAFFRGLTKTQKEWAENSSLSIVHAPVTVPPAANNEPGFWIDKTRGRSFFFSSSETTQNTFVWTVTTTGGTGIARVVLPLSTPNSRAQEFFSAIAYAPSSIDVSLNQREPRSSSVSFMIGQILGTCIGFFFLFGLFRVVFRIFRRRR